jgi:hypothetical protein
MSEKTTYEQAKKAYDTDEGFKKHVDDIQNSRENKERKIPVDFVNDEVLLVDSYDSYKFVKTLAKDKNEEEEPEPESSGPFTLEGKVQKDAGRDLYLIGFTIEGESKYYYRFIQFNEDEIIIYRHDPVITTTHSTNKEHNIQFDVVKHTMRKTSKGVSDLTNTVTSFFTKKGGINKIYGGFGDWEKDNAPLSIKSNYELNNKELKKKINELNESNPDMTNIGKETYHGVINRAKYVFDKIMDESGPMRIDDTRNQSIFEFIMFVLNDKNVEAFKLYKLKENNIKSPLSDKQIKEIIKHEGTGTYSEHGTQHDDIDNMIDEWKKEYNSITLLNLKISVIVRKFVEKRSKLYKRYFKTQDLKDDFDKNEEDQYIDESEPEQLKHDFDKNEKDQYIDKVQSEPELKSKSEPETKSETKLETKSNTESKLVSVPNTKKDTESKPEPKSNKSNLFILITEGNDQFIQYTKNRQLITEKVIKNENGIIIIEMDGKKVKIDIPKNYTQTGKYTEPGYEEVYYNSNKNLSKTGGKNRRSKKIAKRKNLRKKTAKRKNLRRTKRRGSNRRGTKRA